MKKSLLYVFILLSSFGMAQVGIDTTNPLSTLDVNGSLSLKVKTITGGPNTSSPEEIDGAFYINLTPTPTNRFYILPDATKFPGRIYIIRNISDDYNAELASLGGDFFPTDSKDKTGVTLSMPPDSNLKTIMVISDSFNWTYFEQ